MSDSSSLELLGAIAGLIGTITGIAGLVLGFIGYRRSGQLKLLDLRLELRRAVSDLHLLVDELPRLLERSRQSRVAVASAKGTSGSGNLAAWKERWKSDMDELRSLRRALPERDSAYAQSTDRELEAALVAVHTLQTRASGLQRKYLGEIAADDHDRDHIRDDMRQRVQDARNRGSSGA